MCSRELKIKNNIQPTHCQLWINHPKLTFVHCPLTFHPSSSGPSGPRGSSRGRPSLNDLFYFQHVINNICTTEEIKNKLIPVWERKVIVLVLPFVGTDSVHFVKTCGEDKSVSGEIKMNERNE